MKILITGGAGFLGSHLAEGLLKDVDNTEVISLDIISKEDEYKISHLIKDPRFKFVRGSILDTKLMDGLVSKCDIIYHFAAIVGVEHYVARPYDVLNVNVNGTKAILDLAYKYGKKIVFASTSEIYGKSTKIPFAEDDDRVLGPTKIDRWCYSSAKAVGEHFCFAYHQRGLPVVILRFFNAYGPRLDSIESGRVISIFMGQLLRGEPLTVIGDGKQTRCFTYVDDTVEAVIKAGTIKEAEGEVFNIGTDIETPIIELANKMVEIYGEDNKGVKFIESEGVYGMSYEDIERRVPCVKKAGRILGFEAKTSLEEGLNKTIDWFKSYYRKKKNIKDTASV